MARDDEPVYLGDQLIGWHVFHDDQYMTMPTINGTERILVQKGGKVFVPAGDQRQPATAPSSRAS